MSITTPQIFKATLKTLRNLVFISAVVLTLQIPTSRPAQATCCVCTDCFTVFGFHVSTIAQLTLDIQSKVQSFFMGNVIGEFTAGIIRPQLTSMAMELTTANHWIGAAIGAMVDGQVHNNHIKELQTLQVNAIRDHMPAVSMCQYATLAKSVGASDHRRDITQQVLSKRSLDRQFGVQGLSGSDGVNSSVNDLNSRFAQYLSTYCDPQDEYGNIASAYGAACAGSDARLNRDIDYTGLIHSNATLDIDLTNTTPTNDELDVFSMATNLYSSDLILRPQDELLRNPENNDRYLAMRSLIAKRAVAENSFNSLVALKTKNPNSTVSYYEEMERLTKNTYQDPGFYASLYDNPANVTRQKAAMQGIGLMQQRDIYESQIRSEMLLSVLLETRLDESTKDTQGAMLK
tara:strand:- start:363826 stop:365034 length:1209 start_codon:yes stop_codon:yes gene_type:complete